MDVYSSYEAGLRKLLKRLGPERLRHSEALVYQQRLVENIAKARLYGDTDELEADRSAVIERLNRLACSQLDVTFNDLCRLVPERPVEPLSEPSTAPPTVLIPAGPFWMGSSRDDAEAHENEKPRRRVHLQDYQIGRYTVTNTQYAFFVRDTGYDPPGHWEGGMVPTDLEDHPVVNVNYGDAQAYCHWLSQVTDQCYRLPTEDEWEKAARGELPETRRYPWGDDWRSGCCNTRELGQGKATSVHEFERANQSPFGVIDMVGNVWEWTASWYERYPGSTHQGLNYGQIYRVVRGGSWRSYCQAVRISCRGRYEPPEQRPYLGFRIVSDARARVGGVVPEMGEAEEASVAAVGAQVLDTPTEVVPEQIDRAKLRCNLRRYFDESELRDLCFDLKVDYDSLRGDGKGDRARELVAYMERRGRISELVEACRQLRPSVLW
jgi:formylglycine-generating enzyme required for sulfatase activity